MRVVFMGTPDIAATCLKKYWPTASMWWASTPSPTAPRDGA
ncbi:MAG: hypothetical protein ACLS4A_04585 [Oscillospiraceae bacterium]